MNYDENGGNSTTQNAYQRGQAAAKLKGEGASRLAGAASNALTASGHPVLGKGAQMLSNNLAKQNAAASSTEEDVEQGVSQGSEMVNKAIEKGASTAAKAAGVPAPLANAAGKQLSKLTNNFGGAGEKVEEVQKVVKTAKLIWKLSPFIGAFSGILLIAGLLGVAINGADQALDKFVSGAETVLNVLTLERVGDNQTNIRKNIEAAANDCSDCLFSGTINNHTGLDKGILYATINNSAIVGPEAYGEDVDSDDTQVGDVSDGSSYLILDKWNTHSFYNMKLDMLGDTGTRGTMIYSLIGEEISVSCVTSNEYSTAKNAAALVKYAYNGLLTGMDTAATTGKDIVGWVIPGTSGAKIVSLIDDFASYDNQDASWLDTKMRELEMAFSDNAYAAVKEDLQNLISDMNACKSQYEYVDGKIKTDKNGNYVTLKPSFETKKINDYQQYFNYITKVYTPTMYHSTWGSLTSEERVRLARNVWSDIVGARNDFYGMDGEGSYLSYSFDLNGKLQTVVSGNSIIGGNYVSNIPVGTAGTGWHQNRSPWSSYQLGSDSCVTSKGYPCNMGTIGCYITSISILMANSGTQINSDTFDPGVLARTLKANGAINSSGSTVSFSWANLAPNFSYVKNAYTSGLVPSQITQFLSEGYEVMIHVDGHHWVAVVGVENGRILIADPWDYGQTGAVYLDAWKYKNVDIVSAFKASDKH